MGSKDTIKNLFEYPIYCGVLEKHKSKNKKYKEIALKIKEEVSPVTDWDCDTFNTLGAKYDLLRDECFADLIQDIGQKVGIFAEKFFAKGQSIVCDHGWLNIATHGGHQEDHMHGQAHFSAVYYISTPKNCGSLVMRSPDAFSSLVGFEVGNYNSFNSKKHILPSPSEGDFVIFRADMVHYVQKNKSQEPRISIAFNFRII